MHCKTMTESVNILATEAKKNKMDRNKTSKNIIQKVFEKSVLLNLLYHSFIRSIFEPKLTKR